MPHLIDVDEISEMADKPWTTQQNKRAANLLEGIDGWIERNAPCLAPGGGATPGALAEAKEVVAEALLRAIAAGTGNVASQSQAIGPDSTSVTHVDRAALPTLTNSDKDRLRSLCPRPRKRRQGIGVVRVRPGY